MERIAIAMQDGGAGRVRGMKRRHEPRGQPHFVLPPDLYNGTLPADPSDRVIASS